MSNETYDLVGLDGYNNWNDDQFGADGFNGTRRECLMEAAQLHDCWNAEDQAKARYGVRATDGAVEDVTDEVLKLYAEVNDICGIGETPPLPKVKSARWPRAITTERDAYNWFLHLLVVERLNFHPDDNAEGYVDESGRPTFCEADALRYNQLMDQAFEVCADVYDGACRALDAYKAAQVFSTRKWDDGSYMVQMRGDGVYDTVGELHMPKEVAHQFATELNEAALRALLATEQQKTEVARG